MKTIALAAIVAAVTMSLSVHAKTAPGAHLAGAPVKQGNFCWVGTDSLGHGWWDQCDTSYRVFPRARFLRNRPPSEYGQIGNGGGEGGGGGSGSAR